MYKRKMEKTLLAWKNRPDHKPIVIKGVRQCGKTSTVKAFAEQEYENVLYINFYENKEIQTVFNGALSIDVLLSSLSLYYPEMHFVPNKTAILFDEIQECPQARTSLKFFALDGRFDVLCTGSLLGVSGYKELPVSIPVGYEEIITMYPMDFEEFLWANGVNDSILNLLKEHLNSETPIPEGIHHKMREYLLNYILIGGMPEVLTIWQNTKNLNTVLNKQRNIVDDYRTDMIKYAKVQDRIKIVKCFDSIPSQLSKDNSKFQYSLIKKSGRQSEFVSCLDWIEEAGITIRCNNVSLPQLPLSGFKDENVFKIYMQDIGLFVSMLEDGTQKDILMDNMKIYKGPLYETLLAGIFSKMGRKLYYYRKESGLEIDFLIRYKDTCTLVECKAGNGHTRSLTTILSNPDRYGKVSAIKFANCNIGRKGEILTLPMYMAFLLQDY